MNVLTYSTFNGGFFPLQRLDSVQVAFFNIPTLLVGFLYILQYITIVTVF